MSQSTSHLSSIKAGSFVGINNATVRPYPVSNGPLVAKRQTFVMITEFLSHNDFLQKGSYVCIYGSVEGSIRYINFRDVTTHSLELRKKKDFQGRTQNVVKFDRVKPLQKKSFVIKGGVSGSKYELYCDQVCLFKLVARNTLGKRLFPFKGHSIYDGFSLVVKLLQQGRLDKKSARIFWSLCIGTRLGREKDDLFTKAITALKMYDTEKEGRYRADAMNLAKTALMDYTRYSGLFNLIKLIPTHFNLHPIANCLFLYFTKQPLDYELMDKLLEDSEMKAMPEVKELEPINIDWQDIMNEISLSMFAEGAGKLNPMFNECQEQLSHYVQHLLAIREYSREDLIREFKENWFSSDTEFCNIFRLERKAMRNWEGHVCSDLRIERIVRMYLEDTLSTYTGSLPVFVPSYEEIELMSEEELRSLWKQVWKSSQRDFCIAYGCDINNLVMWLRGHRSMQCVLAVRLFLKDCRRNTKHSQVDVSSVLNKAFDDTTSVAETSIISASDITIPLGGLSEDDINELSEEELRVVYKKHWKSTEMEFCTTYDIEKKNLHAWLKVHRKSPSSMQAVRLFLLSSELAKK